MEETDYLLRSPANAAHLIAAADQVRQGRTLLTKTMDELIIIQARYHYDG